MPDPARSARRLARGLEDLTRLFLSGSGAPRPGSDLAVRGAPGEVLSAARAGVGPPEGETPGEVLAPLARPTTRDDLAGGGTSGEVLAPPTAGDDLAAGGTPAGEILAAAAPASDPLPGLPASSESDAPTAGPAAAAGATGLRLVSLVCKNLRAMEPGLRLVDANVPVEVAGVVDLVAIDHSDRLVIIDVDGSGRDDLLLRGVCHQDWFVRNGVLARRMYSGSGIDFAAEPRVVLLAPWFSPAALCAARRLSPLGIVCMTFRTVSLPGGSLMLFDRVAGGPGPV